MLVHTTKAEAGQASEGSPAPFSVGRLSGLTSLFETQSFRVSHKAKRKMRFRGFVCNFIILLLARDLGLWLPRQIKANNG